MGRVTETTEVKVDDLVPYAKNARVHDEEQVEMIARSIEEFGFLNPILIDRDRNVIAGHGRILAAKKLGMGKVPVLYVEGLTEEQRQAYVLADNRLTELGGWNMELVEAELEELIEAGFDISITGFDTEREEPEEHHEEQARQTLADRFILPPFSILNTTTGWWQDRKRAWKNIGIKSELGRGNDGDRTKDGLTFAKSAQPPHVYAKKNAYESLVGHTVTWDEFYEQFPNAGAMSGTSVFDPVVCEMAYRWFSKDGAKIIDPFAGGSVRGIVAALLGRDYTGVDLSAKQIAANFENWDSITHTTITGEESTSPSWINGDSENIKDIAAGEYDLLFTCPPYADLEVYSDDPRDISNMDYSDFLGHYRSIIRKSVSMLKPDSFAVVVISEVRDEKGNYRNLVSDTIDAFMDAGMVYYNECILVGPSGSAAIRAGKPFKTSRKTTRVHQNVLVFFADGSLKSIREDDAEEQEEDILETLADRGGRIVDRHTKLLTFAKGDVKALVDSMGEVDADINSEYFEVNIDV